MNINEFDNILARHWHGIDYELMLTQCSRPQLLTMFAKYAFMYNLQGPDIDKIRTFLIKMSDDLEHFTA